MVSDDGHKDSKEEVEKKSPSIAKQCGVRWGWSFLKAIMDISSWFASVAYLSQQSVSCSS
jgi:hypothetical protein